MNKRKVVIFNLLFIFGIVNIFAQDSTNPDPTKPSIFIGYDLGEMAFNNFQNFAGEIGVKLKKDHMVRFVYLNVKLTEAHLSSSFAAAVDGENVSGLWNGYELLYDLPIYRFKNGRTLIYGGVSAGYHKNSYQHTILAESIENKTATIGFDIGFRETNIFKINGLYINFQIPFRYKFNALEETKLGDATVNKSVFEQTISFFVGYEF